MKRLLLAFGLASYSLVAVHLLTGPCHRGTCDAPRFERAPVAAPVPPPVVVEDDAPTLALRAVARDVEASYRDGRRDDADALVARTPGLFRCDDASPGAPRVLCTYRSSGRSGSMLVAVWRPEGTSGPVGVAFPPGTFGTGQPTAQDLAFTRAPVVVVAPGEPIATVTVPIACAKFNSGSPRTGMRYELASFERGSAIDRLMCELCSGEPASEPEAQLAIWMARNDISRQEFVRHRRVCTFWSGMPIGVEDATGAGDLLRGAGIDLDGLRFFKPDEPVRSVAPRMQRPTRVETEEREPAQQPAQPSIEVADPA
jgi:hypothetical protein